VSSDAPKFIVERGLSPLCKAMRMLGFDVLDRSTLSLRDSLRRAIEERRIWLRREMDLTSNQYGVRYFILEAEDIGDQLSEINSAYNIADFTNPFSRCLICNMHLRKATQNEIKDNVPARTLEHFDRFYYCDSCQRIYWHGSHILKMKKKLRAIGWDIQ